MTTLDEAREWVAILENDRAVDRRSAEVIRDLIAMVEARDTALDKCGRYLLIARAERAEKAHRVGAEQMRREAAQFAFDQTSDDPQPGDWNEACEHIAAGIRALPWSEGALDEKIAVIEDVLEYSRGYQRYAQVAVLEAVLADLRAWRKLEPETTQAGAEPSNIVDFHQRRGVAWDIIDEAIETYDGWLLDDDYDAQGALSKIMNRMRERREALRALPVE